MQIAVIGCGGIGGVFAASLAAAGEDMTPVVGSSPSVEALAAKGLWVTEVDGRDWSVKLKRPPVLSLKETSRVFDLAIFATQGTALEASLKSALPHLARDARVVVCQNGLPEERAKAILRTAGPSRVVGCVVGWGASMVSPGVIRRTSGGGLQIGGAGDLSELARLLDCVAPTMVVPDLAGVRWSKLAINCVTTTFGALGGVPLGRLLGNRRVRRAALECFAEVHAVATAAGVAVKPVGGTFALEDVAISEAERRLPFGSPSLAKKHALLMAVGFKYRRMRSSMLYALERGRPLEIEHLNGEIVRRGAALGVPTPVNAALIEGVEALAAGGAVPSLAFLREVCAAIPVATVDHLAA